MLALFIGPATALVLVDVYQCWLQRDYVNVIRHVTIVGPMLGMFAKICIFYYHRDAVKDLTDQIDTDYESYNRLPEAYKAVVRDVINVCLRTERVWTACVVTCGMVFPLMATVTTLHSQLFNPEPKRYMVHELNLPYVYETPYYEMLFVYLTCCTGIFMLNFTGFDGFFGLIISHACLKMKLVGMRVQDALLLNEKDDIIKGLVVAIEGQCKVFRYVETIQTTFSFWLVIILLATVMQLCNCMYQLIEGAGFDLRYFIFTLVGVVHIYLPCRYASNLKDMSLETGTTVYQGAWERTRAPEVRRMVVFMIAQCQVPVTITAMNVVTFDMELFISLLQKSYSVFTLLRST